MSSGVQMAGENTTTLNQVNVKSIFSRAYNSLSCHLYRFTKRSFDICFGLIGVTLTLPLALAVKIAYLLSGDYSSIFFVQERIGQGGGLFRFYKFRTMVPNAEQKLKELLTTDKKLAAEYRKNKKLKNDPRVTKFGKILRKTSLDEFPQFFNVLRGDMSLIGNRPYMPQEREEVNPYLFNKIVETKPGISGYWQVSGRSDLDFDKRLELERFYSENVNLLFDCRIFLKTFTSVLSQEGAD